MRHSAPARARAQPPGIARANPAHILAPPRMPAAPSGPHKRLARQIREAALRATPQELLDLERLDRLVRAEAITVFEAQHLLTTLLRHQNERTQPKAAA